MWTWCLSSRLKPLLFEFYSLLIFSRFSPNLTFAIAIRFYRRRTTTVLSGISVTAGRPVLLVLVTPVGRHVFSLRGVPCGVPASDGVVLLQELFALPVRARRVLQDDPAWNRISRIISLLVYDETQAKVNQH